MAYDEKLADRVRDVLEEAEGVTERNMFGGLAFMLRGHMACGIVGDDLMLRLGAEGAMIAMISTTSAASWRRLSARSSPRARAAMPPTGFEPV